MLLPVGFWQQLRGGNEALNVYIKPNFKIIVKQKKQVTYEFKFDVSLTATKCFYEDCIENFLD
jgi:hypothetical protein